MSRRIVLWTLSFCLLIFLAPSLTFAAPTLIKDICSGSCDGFPGELTDVDGTLFFLARADRSSFHRTLWKSNGRSGSTGMVKDINPADSSALGYLTNAGGTLFFRADDGSSGWELWKSDGTGAGTVLVKDIHPSGNSSPKYLTNVDGILFFQASDGVHSGELWKSDGTEAGTIMVKDINPGFSGSDPEELTAVGNYLFFTAEDGTTGRELWKSDGTEGGTSRVADIWGTTPGSDPQYLTQLNIMVMFSADNGMNGRELYGSILGLTTYLIKDINNSYGDYSFASYPEYLTRAGSSVFFAATTSDGSARELWKSDGTEGGTVMVKDINPVTSSNPANLLALGETLFFTADNGTYGVELWQSDGTAEGTFLVRDIKTGDQSSNPQKLTVSNNTLYFVADDGIHGVELWRVDKPPFPWPIFLPSIFGTNR